jgi:hypothetical protein
MREGATYAAGRALSPARHWAALGERILPFWDGDHRVVSLCEG